MIERKKRNQAKEIKYLHSLVLLLLFVLGFLNPGHAFQLVPSPVQRDSSAITSPVDWELGSIDPGQPGLTILGRPRFFDCRYGKALKFDGVGDALFFDSNPLAHLRQFTVEIVFQPDSNGPREQRFLHMGSTQGDRLMVETRVTNKHQWFLDAHLRSGDSAKTLIDSTKIHPTDAWYHLAVTVDDGRMETYVNGIRELAGSIPFSPFKGGQVSVGVRQNKVYWFKGAICRIRVTPRVLNRSEFMRLQDSQIPEPE